MSQGILLPISRSSWLVARDPHSCWVRVRNETSALSALEGRPVLLIFHIKPLFEQRKKLFHLSRQASKHLAVALPRGKVAKDQFHKGDVPSLQCYQDRAVSALKGWGRRALLFLEYAQVEEHWQEAKQPRFRTSMMSTHICEQLKTPASFFRRNKGREGLGMHA